jgi:hypothetical protein
MDVGDKTSEKGRNEPGGIADGSSAYNRGMAGIWLHMVDEDSSADLDPETRVFNSTGSNEVPNASLISLSSGAAKRGRLYVRFSNVEPLSTW